MTPEQTIPLSKCERGVIYRLHSRNLSAGVFDGKDGFIGIREKFDSRYLFIEFHADTGAPYGTAHPLEVIGQVPEDIPLKETLGTIDFESKRPLLFDRPVDDGGRGWIFADTDEDANAKEVRPSSQANTPLFELLDALSV